MTESNKDDHEDIFEDKDEEQEKLKKMPPWKLRTAKALDSWLMSEFMTVITIYALFFDDLRILYFPVSWDGIFYGITAFSLVCFTIEIVLSCIVKEGYWLSFFFVLDVVSTISLIADIGWIMEALLDQTTGLLSIAKTSRAG